MPYGFVLYNVKKYTPIELFVTLLGVKTEI